VFKYYVMRADTVGSNKIVKKYRVLVWCLLKWKMLTKMIEDSIEWVLYTVYIYDIGRRFRYFSDSLKEY